MAPVRLGNRRGRSLPKVVQRVGIWPTNASPVPPTRSIRADLTDLISIRVTLRVTPVTTLK